MSTPSDVLINLEGVTKVFYTDEVETHALAGIHLADSQRRVPGNRGTVRLR